jgi:hypothetical protein
MVRKYTRPPVERGLHQPFRCGITGDAISSDMNHC